VSPSTVTAAGQTVTYSFLTTNTGKQTVHSVAIAEVSFSGTGVLSPIVCPITTLAPGQSTTCTATYTVTQADADVGAVDNTATANGLNPAGGPVVSPQSTAALSVAASGALTLTKAADPTTVSAAGQVISYRLTVTNSGGFTIFNVVAKDSSFSGTGTPPAFTCPAAPLASGASTTCTGSYTVTLADIEAGGDILDTALATGNGPGGQPVVSNPATAAVTIPPEANISLLKSASPATVERAGGQVTYSFLITNTGNVRLTDAVVTEQSFTGTGTLSPITCPTTTLEPGESTTCTATYTVTQDDVDAGSITNTAIATATPPPGFILVVSPPSTATVVAGISRLGLTKTGSIIDTNHNGRTDAGDRIRWTLRVTNLGTKTLHDIAVSDPSTGPATCPSSTLAPGQSMICTVPDHTITAADIEAGTVTDTATATGTNPQGEPVSSGSVSATVRVRKPLLPVTGGNVIGLVAAGGAVLAAGLLVMMLSLVRRNRRLS
jgi:uncharacterized repeat protein (TIGR01451 family)